MNVSEKLGDWLGLGLGQVFFRMSRMRKTSSFHPGGECYTATVQPTSTENSHDLGVEIGRDALIRFSTSLWKKKRLWPDILGCAIRLGWRPEDGQEVKAHHQDLLFITARSTLLLAPAIFTTRSYDFLKDTYYAIGKFRAARHRQVTFRLVPLASSAEGSNRWDRLEAAVRGGSAKLSLEWRARGGLSPWHPIAIVQVTEKVPSREQHRLCFSPFHTGRGIIPTGWLNFSRRRAYAASQGGDVSRVL